MNSPPSVNNALKFLLLFLLHLFFAQNVLADVCTTAIKPVKYTIRSGDDFYSVLKNFGLNPVMGSGGSLEKLQKMNNLIDQNTVEAGTEVVIPISCEEQLLGWRVIDRGEYRLITSEKIDKSTTEKKVKTENITPDATTKNILEKAMPGEEEVDLEQVKDSTDVSEALRYRMICQGEWTGTECITRYSAIYATGGAWYNRYDGTDRATGGSGILLSKMNPEAGLGWTNYWNDHVRTDLGFTMLSSDIQPEVREVPILQSKKNLNSLYGDLRYETGRWGVKLGFNYQERLFYRFNVANVFLPLDGGVTVNAVPIMDLHIGLSYLLKQLGKFRIDGEISFASIQAANTSGYGVNPGSAIRYAFSLSHDRVREYLFGTLQYEASQQNTDILVQKAAELGMKFGYAWKLKDW